MHGLFGRETARRVGVFDNDEWRHLVELPEARFLCIADVDNYQTRRQRCH